MEIIAKGVAARRANIENNLGVLAYRKLKLLKEIEGIDMKISALEAMADENTQAEKDLEAETIVAQAKVEKEPKRKK
jgi:H2-forming N5,N10-methylenetetrahydromethanopterin dehydrogenase-like enzyme